MTEAELNAAIRRLLNEPVEDYFLDTEINSWIVEAVRDISVKAKCVELIDDFGHEAGTPGYNVPSRTIDISAIILPSGRALLRGSVAQFGHSFQSGDDEPQLFAHFGTRFLLSPTPLTSATGGFILYAAWTDTLSVLPEAYHHLIIPYGVMKGRLKEEKYQAAAALYAAYLNEVSFQAGSLQQVTPDSIEASMLPDVVESA